MPIITPIISNGCSRGRPQSGWPSFDVHLGAASGFSYGCPWSTDEGNFGGVMREQGNRQRNGKGTSWGKWSSSKSMTTVIKESCQDQKTRNYGTKTFSFLGTGNHCIWWIVDLEWMGTSNIKLIKNAVVWCAISCTNRPTLHGSIHEKKNLGHTQLYFSFVFSNIIFMLVLWFYCFPKSIIHLSTKSALS